MYSRGRDEMKVKKRYVALSIIVVVFLVSGGCGTRYKYSNYHNLKSPMYAATAFDIEFMHDALFGKDDSMLSPRSLRILIPFFVIDLPFAIVIDTITLPYDCYYQNKKNVNEVPLK